MANPAPFPPTAYDSADWVKTVTPVTVTGGVVTPVTQIQPTQGGTLSTSITSSTANVNLFINDGLQHYLSSVQISLVATAFSGTPPWVGRLLVSTAPSAVDICQVSLGIQSVLSTGQLPANDMTIVFPNGFLIPKKAVSTYQLVYDFFVDVGSGTFAVWASIAATWV